MSEREFREAVRALLNQKTDGLSPEQKSAAVRLELLEFLRNQEFPEPNKHKPWTDGQLRVVLSYAPTERRTRSCSPVHSGADSAASSRFFGGLARVNGGSRRNGAITFSISRFSVSARSSAGSL
jgi:hypothetical protein